MKLKGCLNTKTVDPVVKSVPSEDILIITVVSITAWRILLAALSWQRCQGCCQICSSSEKENFFMYFQENLLEALSSTYKAANPKFLFTVWNWKYNYKCVHMRFQ